MHPCELLTCALFTTSSAARKSSCSSRHQRRRQQVRRRQRRPRSALLLSRRRRNLLRKRARRPRRCTQTYVLRKQKLDYRARIHDYKHALTHTHTQDKPSWKELEALGAAERASAAKSSSMKLADPKARSPKQLLVEESRSAQTKNNPSPRMTRGQRATAVSASAKKPSPPRRDVPAKAASTTKKGTASRCVL